MTTYWFRPKRYGYGATPVTWQGWVVTLGAAIAVGMATARLPFLTIFDPAFWAVLVFDVVVIAALVTVCRRKTDGEWRWRWGP